MNYLALAKQVKTRIEREAAHPEETAEHVTPSEKTGALSRADSFRDLDEGAALERRFGHKAARLYPYLGGMVQTPKGEGRLIQVFTVRVGVVLEASPERVTAFEPGEIRPCADPDGALTGRPVG
jgi:hypothetical protein